MCQNPAWMLGAGGLLRNCLVTQLLHFLVLDGKQLVTAIVSYQPE